MATIKPEVAVQISANQVNFVKGLKDAANSLKGFENLLKNTAKAVGIGFGVQQVASFGIEVARLGGEAQAVSAAFNRLGDAAALMKNLKEITGGTVSELDLMKRTVQAANFGISLKQLPELLQFATLRAQQTGQSVDYLVESIIMGIGRKSPMILDNLGISLVRIREKLKGVGAEAASVADFTRIIGEIAREELGKMPGFAENAATSLQRISAAWANIKSTIGESAFFNTILGGIATFASYIAGTVKKSASELLIQDQSKLNSLVRIITDNNTSLEVRRKLINDLNNQYPNFLKNLDVEKVSNETLKNRLKDVNEQYLKKIAIVTSEEKIAEAQKKVNKLIEEELKLRKRQDELINKPASRSVTTGMPGAYFQASSAEATELTNTQRRLKELPKEQQRVLDELASDLQNYNKILERFNQGNLEFFTNQTKTTSSNVKEMTKEQENYLEKLRKKTLETKSSFFEFAKSLEEAEKKADILQETLNKIFYKKDIKVALDEMVPNKLPKPVGTDFTENLQEQEKNIKNATDANLRYTQNIEKLNMALKRAAAEGLNEFAFGLEQVFNKEISFGDNLLRAVAKFAEAFGKQLILIGAGRIAVGDVAQGALAIAAGTALIGGAQYVQKGISSRMEKLSDAKSISTTNYRNSSEIVVTGQLVGSGRDLVAVINNTQFDNSIRRGG